MLALWVAAGARAGEAEAIVVAPIGLSALTQQSDDVVLGTVARQTVRYEGRHLVTDSEVSVAAVLKGRLVPRGTVFVRTAGGTLGNVTQRIADVPSPEVGESYVFFLSGGVGNTRYLAHATAALVPLRVNAAGQIEAVAPQGLQSAVASGTAGPGVLPLATLAERVGGAR